jgi:integrase
LSGTGILIVVDGNVIDVEQHPHVLRHTFNQRLMEEVQTLGWSDDQRRKVQTYLNGWSDGSRMPEVYTRRLIEIQAMELAERYQATLYEHQEDHA